jgi:hypothetical protein
LAIPSGGRLPPPLIVPAYAIPSVEPSNVR